MTGPAAGPNVRLRPLQRSDAADIFQNINDFETVRHTLAVPWPYQYGHARAFIRLARKNGKKGLAYAWGITLQGKDKVIGLIEVMAVNRLHSVAKIGYWLGRPYWGRGLMTEAAVSTAAFAFDDLGLERLSAHVFAENPASARVLEKAGFRREGLIRQGALRFGRRVDLIMYGRLKNDPAPGPLPGQAYGKAVS